MDDSLITKHHIGKGRRSSILFGITDTKEELACVLKLATQLHSFPRQSLAVHCML